MNTTTSNTTTLTADNFYGAINGDILYLPLIVRPTESNPEGQKFVLKCENLEFLGSDIDFNKFFKNLDFAINVEVVDGYKGIQKSMSLNGYSFEITKAFNLSDFITMMNNDQNGYSYGELDRAIYN